MAEAKVAIIGAIAKQEGKAFRPSAIIDATGLAKQLVNYHLKTLVNKGLVEQTGRVYVCVDLPKLLDVMVEHVSVESKSAWITKFFGKDNVEGLNAMLKMALLAESIKLPKSAEHKQRMFEVIDDTIASLKAARKMLANDSHTLRTRKNWFRDLSYEAMAKKYLEHLTYLNPEAGVRKTEIEDRIYKGLDELDDE